MLFQITIVISAGHKKEDATRHLPVRSGPWSSAFCAASLAGTSRSCIRAQHLPGPRIGRPAFCGTNSIRRKFPRSRDRPRLAYGRRAAKSAGQFSGRFDIRQPEAVFPACRQGRKRIYSIGFIFVIGVVHGVDLLYYFSCLTFSASK